MSNFIHLTNKTEYSLSEGALPISRLAELCNVNSMPAVGITDTNNMFGALEFSERVSSAGVQPIIGCNIKIKTPKELLHENINDGDEYFFLNVFAKSLKGYENLLSIISNSYINSKEHAYVNFNEFLKNNEDIIVLSGANNSILSHSNNGNITNQSKQLIETLKSSFPNNFYLELQRIGKEFENVDENTILTLACDHYLPLVATNNVYYEGPDHYEAHDALMCIEKKLYVSQKDRKKLSREHYFKTHDEMNELFSDLPEAINNTLEIASRCSFRPCIKAPILPNYSNKSEDEKEMLIKLSNEGLGERLKLKFDRDKTSSEQEEIISKEYQLRLDKELEIIINMKYEGYFLIVSDFIRWAKNNDIPVGPGRGSGAGSLVAWCLSITDLDPIKFGLIFERFLNPERVSLPDFDIDFCRDGRDRVLDYVHKKYGSLNVAQIITFGKLQARAVIRDVGRVLGIPYGQVDYLCKLMPFDPSRPMSLQKYIDEEPKLSEEASRDEKIEKLLDISLKLEGLKRHASIHAAGVVISKDEILKDVPLYSDPDSDIYLTQFDMKWVENAGLVKFDFLGLKTLTLIDNCKKLIKERNPNFDIDQIDINDKATYDLLSTGEATGIFQLESAGMKETLKNLKPDKFEDIIALVALYRPGPMANIPSYIERKHGREKPDYIHKKLENLLIETYGIVIYQEQVMGVARELSGYTDGEADLLRRAMGKKIQKEMNAQRKRFISGCTERGLSEGDAIHIFDLMSKFADYGFNKSHAAAYALIAFQTAYLKTHFPIEFFAASMTLDINNTDKLSIFQRELERLDIRLIPPNINNSMTHFVRSDKSIAYALGAIKNVGTESMNDLIKERNQNGKFKSLDDFVLRLPSSVINKKTIESLSCAGAFDEFQIDRSVIFNSAPEIVKFYKSISVNEIDNQVDMFGKTETRSLALVNDQKWDQTEQLMKEYQILGFYLSGHPLESYKNDFGRLNLKSFRSIQENESLHESKSLLLAGTLLSKKEKRSARGNSYAFLNFSDLSSIYELVIFESNLRKYRDILKEGESYVLGVDFSINNGMLRGELKNIYFFKELLKMNIGEKNNTSANNTNNDGSTLRILTNSNFSTEELKKIDWTDGSHNVEIIVNNQILKLPGKYTINTEVKSMLINMNGVNEIKLI